MKPVTGGFPASRRLKIKAQFDWVFDRPNQRCSHGVLQAIYKQAQPIALTGTDTNANSTLAPAVDLQELTNKNNSLKPVEARLGLIVAKRFLPRAVDRNRLKRLIREGFRAQHAQLPPVDIIVRLLRRPSREVSAGEVTQLFGKMQRPNHLPNTDSR